MSYNCLVFTRHMDLKDVKMFWGFLPNKCANKQANNKKEKMKKNIINWKGDDNGSAVVRPELFSCPHIS